MRTYEEIMAYEEEGINMADSMCEPEDWPRYEERYRVYSAIRRFCDWLKECKETKHWKISEEEMSPDYWLKYVHERGKS